MLVFVACHCDGAARAAGLERCLASLEGPDALVCLAYHAATPALAARVATAAARLHLAVASAAPRSQFEHYRALFENADAGDAWVLFNDDDDVAHPRRAARFAAAAAAARAAGAEAASLPHAATADEAAAAVVASAADVDGLLAGGRARLAEFPKESPPRRPASRRRALARRPPRRHWTIAVSPTLLRAFFEAAHPSLLAHRFCDVTFARYARARAFAAPRPAEPWLYFYARHGYEAHLTWLLTPTPADVAMAEASGGDAQIIVGMRRKAERQVSEGAVAGLARVEALCAAAITTADARARALHQSLARPVAEQVLRTFALPD